jgi:hypothetical protein
MLVANCTLAQGSVGRVPALPGRRPICGVSCRRRPWALTHSTRLKLDPRREDGRLVLQVPGRDGGSLTRCPSLGELAGLGSHQRRCAGPSPVLCVEMFATCAVGRRRRAARSITWMGRSGYGLGELDGGGSALVSAGRRRRSRRPCIFPRGPIPLQVNGAVPLSHPRVDRAAVARRGIP